MNEYFETLPFAALDLSEGELPRLRGAGPARGGFARPVQRGGLARPPQRGWPRPPRTRRRLPVFGGYYGAWPYPVEAPWPAPFAYAPAFPEPEPEPDEPPDGQEEVAPPSIAATLGRMPAARRPSYQALGAIADALGQPAASGPGLYVIEFNSEGRARAYSGQTGDLRRRLQQHLLCVRMMGMSPAGHQVYVAQTPSLSEAQRRALERSIHTDMFARHAGVLTNQRRELELEFSDQRWS